MCLLYMLFRDFLIRSVGTLLIWIGIGGHIFNGHFDQLIGRNHIHYGWGGMQWSAFVIFWGFIYWGWEVRRFNKSCEKDERED